MLDGQGADESLAGYHTYFKTMALKLLSNRDIFGYLSLRAQYKKNIGPFPVSNVVLMESFLPKWLVGLLMITFKPLLRRALPQANVNYRLQEALAPSLMSCYSGDPSHNNGPVFSLNQELQQHVKSIGLPSLLRYEDRNSMAHSIEARVPFLDYRLIDFVFTLPDEWRINGIWTKYILRQAMKGILPELIRTRVDKIGFKASPSITFDYIKDNFASLVESRTDFEKQWLNQAGFERLISGVDESASGDFILWRFLNLKLWVRQHWG